MNTTKNRLDHNIRGQSIDLLQAALSDAVDLVAQTKQAHWNVKGPDFIALHELFDRLHGEMDEHADTIAERLVSLGGQARGTVQSSAKASRLSPYPEDVIDQLAHVETLSDAYAAFSANLFEAIGSADEIGDPVTADVFTGVARDIDKSLWFIEAHLPGESV